MHHTRDINVLIEDTLAEDYQYFLQLELREARSVMDLFVALNNVRKNSLCTDLRKYVYSHF